ncbi:MAG: hypothetical protein AAF360_16700 [Pseudomonadota bacterium]
MKDERRDGYAAQRGESGQKNPWTMVDGDRDADEKRQDGRRSIDQSGGTGEVARAKAEGLQGLWEEPDDQNAERAGVQSIRKRCGQPATIDRASTASNEDDERASANVNRRKLGDFRLRLSLIDRPVSRRDADAP